MFNKTGNIMWKSVESKVQPKEVDTTISIGKVYIRKNIMQIDRNNTPMYAYQEQVLDKDDWQLYQDLTKAELDITTLEESICDLTEIIAGLTEAEE